MKLEWIKDTDWQNILTGTNLEIAEMIGIDNLIKLLEHYGKSYIYFSEKDMPNLKKDYIIKNYEPNSPEMIRKFTRDLDVSQRFVYAAVAEMGNDNQIPMFEEE